VDVRHLHHEGSDLMSRLCVVCQRADRAEIDAALVAGTVSNRRVAARLKVSESSVRRHRENHIHRELVKAKEASDVTSADDLLGKVQGLEADARRIGQRAEKTGDLRTALQSIGQLVKIVELLAKVMGALEERQRIELCGPGGGPIDFSKLSLDELEAMARGGK
jgi:predicted ArsR family transcriptional regulator